MPAGFPKFGSLMRDANIRRAAIRVALPIFSVSLPPIALGFISVNASVDLTGVWFRIGFFSFVVARQ
jgi:hypothetical protein